LGRAHFSPFPLPPLFITTTTTTSTPLLLLPLFIFEHRHRQAALKPLAHVKRDGKVSVMDAAFLVPGDLVLLASGGAVPADCVINQGQIDVDQVSYFIFVLFGGGGGGGVVVVLLFPFQRFQSDPMGGWLLLTIARSLFSCSLFPPHYLI
jgi:hypothetical protein